MHLTAFETLSLTTTPVGGPDRPPSKRMIEQMRIDEQERRQALREGRAPPSNPQGSDEGYLAYMSRQVQERTERLGIVGDSMDRLEENSSNFASDVGKYVQNQKRKAVFGGKSFALVKIAPCVVRYMRLTDLFGSPWVEVWFLGFSLKQTGCYLYRDAAVRKVDTQLKTISVASGSFVYRSPQLSPLAMMNIHADGHGSNIFTWLKRLTIWQVICIFTIHVCHTRD